MAAHKLDRETCRKACEAVAAHGGIVSTAARALGISRATLADRIRSAWAHYKISPSSPGGDIIKPELPTAHEPVEELIERRKRGFVRRSTSHTAKRWMRFEVPEVKPFGLLFVGDPHVDDEGCDWPTLERHLALLAEPGIHGVGLGDWTNNWIGKLSRLHAEQSVTQADAWRLAEYVLQRPGWMLLLRGNHDMWSGSGDPLHWMVRPEAVPLLDWQAQFEVACGDREWRIWAAHDFPGHSMWNKLHAPLRRAKMGGHEADLYIAAHRHTFALAEEQDEHTGRVSWLARARGYKALDSYANVHGFGSNQDRGQSILAVCTPEDGRMWCFSDVERGAQWLTYLRNGKVRVPAITR